MKKKLYITIITLLAILTFSISYTFAANNITVVDGIRNVVGGAENVMENAGNGIVSGVRNITSAGQNTMENVTGDIGNGMQNAGNTVMGGMTTDDDYTATRTTTRMATDTTDTTFLGMNSTVWTWLIMAIVGIAIVALVWMYAKQRENSYNEYK